MPDWTISSEGYAKYTEYFNKFVDKETGKVYAKKIENIIAKQPLSMQHRKQIWDLANPESDAYFSKQMFLITLHLIQKAKEGKKLPVELPQELIMSSFDKQQKKEETKKVSSPSKLH